MVRRKREKVRGGAPGLQSLHNFWIFNPCEGQSCETILVPMRGLRAGDPHSELSRWSQELLDRAALLAVTISQ